MLEKIKARLRSKTYRVAIVMALLSIIEVQSQWVAGLLPASLRPYLLLAWPLAMITLREVTTGALDGNRGSDA